MYYLPGQVLTNLISITDWLFLEFLTKESYCIQSFVSGCFHLSVNISKIYQVLISLS